MKISEAEKKIMEILWQKKKAILKEIIEEYEDPKPAPTTVATFLKRMQQKNLIAYHALGRTRQYYPLLEKKDYLNNKMQGIVQNFFNNSVSQFASFFTANAKLSQKELKELRQLIDHEIEKQEKDENS